MSVHYAGGFHQVELIVRQHRGGKRPTPTKHIADGAGLLGAWPGVDQSMGCGCHAGKMITIGAKALTQLE